MTTSSLRERLLRRSEEAALRHSQSQAEEERRRRDVPGPGDLFYFPETDELQWAVLERGPDGRLRAVAADVHPAIGSADVAVPPESACGALSLRCRLDVWITADHFDLERRTGSLEPAVLERARQKRAALDERRPLGTLSEQETDQEPEYQDLVNELELARAALRGGRASTKEPGGRYLPIRRTGKPWDSMSGPFALAAIVLLVVSLALASGLIQQLRAAREYEERIAELEQRASRDDPSVDLAYAWLSPQVEVRGFVKTLVLSREMSSVVLVLEVGDPEPYPSYRVDLREKDADSPLFSDVVPKAGITEVPVLLPRRLLGAGEYQLSLYGLRGDAQELVGKYLLSVELE